MSEQNTLSKEHLVFFNSKEILQIIMDSIPQYIFWKDINSVYMGCNKNFAIFAGLQKPEDIIGKTDFELKWLKEDADNYTAVDKKIMDSDKPEFNIIQKKTDKNGNNVWMLVSKVPLHDNEQKVIGILGNFYDITEKKKITEELKESEETFKNIINAIPLGIHMYQYEENDKFTFIGYNPTADKILKWITKVLLAKQLIMYFHTLQIQKSLSNSN